MNTLIKQYYSEPQVDSRRIMKAVLGQFSAQKHSEHYLIFFIAMGLLLCVFGWFLVELNLNFFSVALSLYLTIGSGIFILCNLMVGVLLFIIQYHTLLIAFAWVLIALETGVFVLKKSSLFTSGKQAMSKEF